MSRSSHRVREALGAATLVCAPLLFASALPAQQVERYTLSGSDVAVYDLAGQVSIVAGSGSDVVVEVTRGGADAGKLRVESGDAGGRSTLRILFAGDRIVYRAMGPRSRTQVNVRDDGTFDDGRGFRDRRITVAGDGSGVEAHADLRVMVPRGRAITVHLAAGATEVSDVDGAIHVASSAASIRSRGTRGALKLEAGSGTLDVADASGSVDLETGSGRITAAGVRGNQLKIDAGSGSVNVSDVDVATLAVDVGSGGIEMDGARSPDVKLESGSGSIRAALTGVVRALRIETGSGSVALRLPANTSAELDVETGSGGIHSDIPIQVTRSERSHLIGRMGDGQGRIRIETGSGSVTLQRN